MDPSSTLLSALSGSACLSLCARYSAQDLTRENPTGFLVSGLCDSYLVWKISSLANGSLGILSFLPLTLNVVLKDLGEPYPIFLKTVNQLNHVVAAAAVVVHLVASVHLMLTSAPLAGGAIMTMLFLGAVKTYGSPPEKIKLAITVLEWAALIVDGGIVVTISSAALVSILIVMVNRAPPNDADYGQQQERLRVQRRLTAPLRECG